MKKRIVLKGKSGESDCTATVNITPKDRVKEYPFNPENESLCWIREDDREIIALYIPGWTEEDPRYNVLKDIFIQDFRYSPADIKDLSFDDVIGILKRRKGKSAGQEVEDNENNVEIKNYKVPWDENNTNYMLLSDAIVKFANSNVPMSTLSNKIKGGIPIHHMKKGQRCQVHIGDFRKYIKTNYAEYALSEDAADRIIADFEARKAEARARREAVR